MAGYDYQVFSPLGHIVLETTADCRYAKETETKMLEAGYAIRLSGRKLTKTEIRKEAQKCGK